MTDAELDGRLRANITAFKQFQASQGSLRSLTLPGLAAFAQPNHPQLMGQQQVFFHDTEALRAALPTLEDFYRSHGVQLWRVWVPPGNPVGPALERAGYRPEGSTPAMGLSLADTPLTPPSLPLEELPSQEELIPLNAEAFGPSAAFELRPWHSQPYGPVRIRGIREAGRLIAAGLSFDVEDTAGIYLVATAPSARKRGLATEVMRGLLLDARARNQRAAVLQSTVQGHSVYLRMGFRDLGDWVNWVRRWA
ncbi:GNAT family N-acetyltransferase [Hyalangium minutum]|uniref:Acetyltransferase, GNAT family protein n=1 Tax=Hyalangium minutum TaxID=394096 RepID=A0A085WKV3_9BACT|nr:GNAT family N-acetyltransferase [Hyalangium minutum]KFE68316.1 acetyltransferase, GNAT family protein [Hyalangium minutum]